MSMPCCSPSAAWDLTALWDFDRPDLAADTVAEAARAASLLALRVMIVRVLATLPSLSGSSPSLPAGSGEGEGVPSSSEGTGTGSGVASRTDSSNGPTSLYMQGRVFRPTTLAVPDR